MRREKSELHIDLHVVNKNLKFSNFNTGFDQFSALFVSELRILQNEKERTRFPQKPSTGFTTYLILIRVSRGYTSVEQRADGLVAGGLLLSITNNDASCYTSFIPRHHSGSLLRVHVHVVASPHDDEVVRLPVADHHLTHHVATSYSRRH